MNDDRTILYAIDGGNNRVLEIDVNSANRLRSLGLINEN